MLSLPQSGSATHERKNASTVQNFVLAGTVTPVMPQMHPRFKRCPKMSQIASVRNNDVVNCSAAMLWGNVDGKDVHLVTLKTDKLEATGHVDVSG